MSLRIVALAVLTAGLAATGQPPAPDGEVPGGTWAVVSSEEDGKPSEFPTKGTLYTFADGKVTGGPKKAGGKVLYTFQADPKKDPKEIDLVREDDKKKVVLRGIYRLEKGRLVICVGVATGDGEDRLVEGKRPTEFKSGPGVQLLTLEPGGH
jgi:uncharacterized protein (TIGR03067 family)